MTARYQTRYWENPPLIPQYRKLVSMNTHRTGSDSTEEISNERDER